MATDGIAQAVEKYLRWRAQDIAGRRDKVEREKSRVFDDSEEECEAALRPKEKELALAKKLRQIDEEESRLKSYKIGPAGKLDCPNCWISYGEHNEFLDYVNGLNGDVKCNFCGEVL